MADNKTETDEIYDIAEKTMLGDLRDVVLDIFKHEENIKPWQELTESEQRELAERVENRVRDSIKQAVGYIASNGYSTIQAELEKVTIKDQYQCVINVSKHIDERHQLADAAGGMILITVANDEAFLGAEEAEIDLDQPSLPIADKAA